MYVCMYVCMYACMYVRTYVCMGQARTLKGAAALSGPLHPVLQGRPEPSKVAGSSLWPFAPCSAGPRAELPEEPGEGIVYHIILYHISVSIIHYVYHVYIYIYVYLCVYIYIYIYTCYIQHTCLYVYIYIHIYIYTCIYIYIYTHM